MVMRRLCNRVPRHIYIGLWIALAVWLWNGFKVIEPRLLPVVSGFAITEVSRSDDSHVMIRGIVTKQRDCRFIQLAGYSGPDLLNVRFTETSEAVNRVPGAQSFGWWVITPSVQYLRLYADHECATGRVRTKLFDGVIDD